MPFKNYVRNVAKRVGRFLFSTSLKYYRPITRGIFFRRGKAWALPWPDPVVFVWYYFAALIDDGLILFLLLCTLAVYMVTLTR